MKHLVRHLRSYGDRSAVHTAERTLSYRSLADRVERTAAEFAGGRQLILLEARNDIATLVHYLGALAGGHVVLPVPPGVDHTDLLATYRPDIVIDATGVHRRGTGGHQLHPDLALLLSTSGSTGSPKLVRLSAANLLANAESIAEYLDIRDIDCAATTLPMSYCYGLSVIHSHLLRGAALILTDLSVIDDAFWELFARHRGTSLAGVPYTFDLLDRIGFDTMVLPHLRYLTQAGGRLEPDRVRQFAALGRRRGWQLFVMYGATEATARMAYLPPELAGTRAEAIGRAVPGGHLWIDAPDGEIGELVYQGPNVMMGYAHSAADLASAPGTDVLRTGDLARRAEDGLFEVVGRANRFAKLFGLRIDLQRVESTLRERGIAALCTTDDDILVTATTADAQRVRRAVGEITGLPAGSVRAVTVDELPMLPSGKPDYPAVRALRPEQSAATALRAVFADVLHLDPAHIDSGASFVDLGGNSLSYVTMSVRIERVLHELPPDWHRLPLGELEQLTPRKRGWVSTLETSVALRAIAIVLIVGSHAELFEMWGGAHILLGVAGYNFGRFCLTSAPRGDRVRHLRNTIGWIALPAVAWVAITMTFSDDYGWSNLLLANKFLGPFDSMTAGRLWFIEVLVWTLVLLTVLLWVPAVDRLERRGPFAFALVFLAAGVVLRYDAPGPDPGEDAWFNMLAFWFFAVGWAVAKSSTVWQRAAITALLAVGLFGYFGDPVREGLVFAGITLMIWLPAIRCPVLLTGVFAALADASLYIYLTHFQIYPLFGEHRLLGVLAALVFGVVVAQLVTRLRAAVHQRSPIIPSWTRVAAMTPSARTSDAVITPRPREAAGDRDSSRFH
ncbi:AMP-dependent synthetase [Mycobacterium adipatum]|jgi:acyl-CoA synthetase (AMP-forming)/AMP-acid ligase II|uniref:AMP-dependent synthetase n=1 Tax=Mycobacterium adipatum TaxID=1682113 RepID=A0A172UQM2_9MYCO|nr:AMP-dependent synthetase [Mycobacterium adipatum]